jgi:hypothetical protein
VNDPYGFAKLGWLRIFVGSGARPNGAIAAKSVGRVVIVLVPDFTGNRELTL